MHKREVTAKISVSRLPKDSSRMRRMSAGEKRENTSSADSGSSQNYGVVRQEELGLSGPGDATYPCPVAIIRRYVFLLRELENALLEDELRVGRTHIQAGLMQPLV